jgi:predicted MPP superfamily phosphohydrolase
VVLALAGAVLGVLLLGRINAPLGPFDATLAFRPVGGGAQVDIPPLGSLSVDVYDGPLQLQVQLHRLDEDRARAIASDPQRLGSIVTRVEDDLHSAVVRLAWTTALAALGGAAVVSFVALRRPREPFIAAGLCTALLLGTGALGAATWRPEALSQPTYTGLLVNANSLIGSAKDIAAKFSAYRDSLEKLVTNVSKLYDTLSALPAPGGDTDTVALLHVSDIHLNPAGFDLMNQVVHQFHVDAVLDTGDITDWGSQPENSLITSVGSLGVPYVYIRGNHDSATTAALIAGQPNATVLDDSATTVAGIEVVGAPDPRFTPDKDAQTGDDESLAQSGRDLARVAKQQPTTPAIAMVHDPKEAEELDGVVPLVLAGHLHKRHISVLKDGTRLMVEGSTGGAGLRGLEGEQPTPLTCTVLYLDKTSARLRAYDEITLGGLGQTEATIQRTVVENTTAPPTTSAPASASPSG